MFFLHKRCSAAKDATPNPVFHLMKMKLPRYNLTTFAVWVALLMLCNFGAAANFNWFNTNGSWSAGANWEGSAPTGTDANDSLTFGGSVAVPYLSTNDIAAVPFQLDQLIINATDAGASGGSHVIAGNGLRFMNPASQIVVNDTGGVTLNTALEFKNNASLTVAGAGVGTVTLNAGLTSFADIFKSGSSTLRFGTLPTLPAVLASSSNRWIGRLQVSGGAVRFNNNAQSGSTALRSNPVMLSAGSLLTIKRDNGDQVGSYATSLRLGRLSGSGTVLATVTGSAGQNIDNYDIVITALSDPLSSGVFDGTLTLPGPIGLGNDSGKLIVRGDMSQTLSGTVNIYKDVVVGRGATLKLAGNASFASQTTNGAIIFNGGTFVLDNTANNIDFIGRLRDGSVNSSTVETIGGGTLSLIGNVAGTTEMTGRLQLGALNTKVIPSESKPRSGHLNISVTHNAGSDAVTNLRFQSYSRDQSTLQQFATVDFNAKDSAGTTLPLGAAGNNPHIFLSNGLFFVPTNAGGLLNATSGTPSIGWATVNGTDFATYDTTLGVKAVATSAWNVGLGANDNALITGNAFTLSTPFAVNSIRIVPGAQGQSLNIPGAGDLTCTAFLLAGATDFTISAASTGGITGGSARFFYVEKATLTVSASLSQGASGQPVVKSGAGTLVLTNSGNAALPSPVVINEGILRATPESSLPRQEIRLRGGTLELVGGGTFSRDISVGFGSLNWSGVVKDVNTMLDTSVDEDRGSGGLAAFGADITLDFNGAGPANIQWEDVGFVRSGHALIFGSKTATHRVTWSDNLSLTDATAAASVAETNYNAREIRVVDNPGTEADNARITGVVSGNAYNDLLKTGAGTLELASIDGNTYLGATIIEEGTLLVTTDNSSSFATVVKNGATLEGDGIVSAIVLESGAILQPGVDDMGILSATRLLWRSGGVARFDLGSAGQSDTLDLGSGALEKYPVSGTWTFDFGGGGEAGRTYTLMSFGSTTFTAADFTAMNLTNGVSGAFSIVGGELKFITNFPPAVIATQPQSQHKNLGQSVTFTVHLQTPGAYTYQWYKGNALIDNATSDSFTIAAMTADDLAAYKVIISNGITPVTSEEAILTLNTAPTATAQTVSTDEDTAIGITLGGADADNDTLTYTGITQPTHGMLSGTAPNLTYTPGSNFHGSDSFTFKVNDGFGDSSPATISINVASIADPITAGDDTIAPNVAASVLANDSDPDGVPPLIIESATNGAHGTVTISADKTKLTYTPGPNFFNSDTFTYTVKNTANNTASGHVTVRIAQPAAYGIASKNGAVSGEPTGTVFIVIGQPSIAADGRTAFSATYRSPDKKMHSGILFGGTPTVLVHDGSPAEGTALAFSKFGNPIVSSLGDIAFKASLLAAPKGMTEGIWAHDGNAMRLVKRQKDPAPGISGAFYSKFSDIALPDDGRVIFTASLGGVSVATDSTLWREDGAGGVSLLLREGGQLDVAGSQKTIKTFAVFGPGGVGTLDQRRGFNNTGAVLARVGFTDKSSALICINSDGSKETILRTGIFYTETGASISSFNLPTLSDDGCITVQAKLFAAKNSDSVILSRSASGILSVSAREGVTVPNLGGAAYGSFSDPAGGDSNRNAFISKLTPKLGGVTSTTDTILFRVNPAGARGILARKGLSAQGTNGVFSLFKSFAWTGSGNDGVAFVATLKPKVGGVTAANDTGLWAEGSDGTLYLALREGETVQIGEASKTIKSFKMLGAVLGSIGQSHSTNFSGGYAALATFTDNTKGVVTVWVP